MINLWYRCFMRVNVVGLWYFLEISSVYGYINESKSLVWDKGLKCEVENQGHKQICSVWVWISWNVSQHF